MGAPVAGRKRPGRGPASKGTILKGSQGIADQVSVVQETVEGSWESSKGEKVNSGFLAVSGGGQCDAAGQKAGSRSAQFGRAAFHVL